MYLIILFQHILLKSKFYRYCQYRTHSCIFFLLVLRNWLNFNIYVRLDDVLGRTNRQTNRPAQLYINGATNFYPIFSLSVCLFSSKSPFPIIWMIILSTSNTFLFF